MKSKADIAKETMSSCKNWMNFHTNFEQTTRNIAECGNRCSIVIMK